MKEFLLRLLAAIGVVSLLAGIVGGLSAWYWYAKLTEPDPVPKEMILTLNFTNPISETISDFGFSLQKLIYDETEATPLIYIARALALAKDDPKIKGVIARFGSEPLKLAQAQEIATALENFRQSGKFTSSYATSYGDFMSSSTNYMLASHFENIWLQPIGSVGLTNLGSEAPFGKTALRKLGVSADFIRREEYKSVMENVTDDHYTQPVKENMQSLFGNLNDQIAQGLSVGRKLDLQKVKDLISGGPYTTNESLQTGLVTKIGYEDEFFDDVNIKVGKNAELVAPSSYLYYFNREQHDETKAHIALIVADGLIVDQAPKGPSRLAENEIIDTDEIVQAFDDAAKDQDVKAILFRVNSPGGSPVASETIRRALIKAKESKKPVYVSMGRVAASGGYWISMDADRIFADPATLTGSIGVIAGKFVLGKLFDKLGITWDTVSTGDNASMWSTRAPFSDKARARMNVMLDETYRAFTDHVAAARKIPVEKISDVAKGRVFTGEQALQVGLIDEVGGINETVLGLKKALNLKPQDRIALSPFPAPETPEMVLFKMLTNLKLGGAMIKEFAPLFQQVRLQIGSLLPLLSQSNGPTLSLPYTFQKPGI
ncbi:MAG: signal peptide peptidase SppA [Alphaproteobacteria bacterium]|nr:signal peptide peptidase SppA [Alphaproteobacteria bacterium]